MARSPYSNTGGIIDSLYKDSNGNVVSLDDLRGRIEAECLDLARFHGDSTGWLERRGAAMNEYQRLQSEVTNQRLMFYCLEPLTEGFSARSVMQAVGMYIGMSLVRPELKGEAHNIVASGADMLSTMFKQSRHQGPAHKALARMLDGVRDRHAAAANGGRLPYTVTSASVEYLRIQNAAYDQMRVGTDKMHPPTTDQVTLAEHRYVDAYNKLNAIPSSDGMDEARAAALDEMRADAKAEMVEARAKHAALVRACGSWGEMGDEERRQVWCECVKMDADACASALFREAEADGVGRMTVIDSTNQLVGNSRLRAEAARKELRARQREQAGDDIGAEIRAGWRYGQDNTYDWQRYSEMGFDVDAAEFSQPDSVLLTEFDEDGQAHYKRVDAWDGTFVRDGRVLAEPMHARAPMTSESLFRTMEGVTAKYRDTVKTLGGMDSLEPLTCASAYVTMMIDGAEQHEAYDMCFSDMFDKLNAAGITADERHDFARHLRNYVSDMSCIVTQARADGLGDDDIAFAAELSASMQGVSDATVEYVGASKIATREFGCDEKSAGLRNIYTTQLLSRSVASMMSFFKRHDYDGAEVFGYADEVYKDADGNATDDYAQYAAAGAVKPGTELSRFLDASALKFADDMICKAHLPEPMREQMVTDFSTMAWLYGRALDTSDAFASEGHIDMASAMANTAVTSNICRLLGLSDVDNWHTIDKVSASIAQAVDEEVATWKVPDDKKAQTNRQTVSAAFAKVYAANADPEKGPVRRDPAQSRDERRRPIVCPTVDDTAQGPETPGMA